MCCTGHLHGLPDRGGIKVRSTTQLINYFPDLPAYSTPETGWISKIPASVVPYAQCMRLHQPEGFYAYYLPYLIAFAYAACIAETTPNPATSLRFAAWMYPVNILLRGIACTFNDNVDQNFDRKVTRCRHRPIARGAVSTFAANIFIIVQGLILYFLLRSAPRLSQLHMLIAVVLFCVYALMKRVTHYPQVFLGLPFAWAIPFSLTILGMDPMRTHRTATTFLFGASMLWTVIYDTVYAHQDINDDEKAGVKSMALRFRHSTKLLGSLLAVAQVAFLTISGVYAGFGPVYFSVTVGGVGATTALYLYQVNLLLPSSCALWFQRQFWLVGGAFFLGTYGEYLVRYYS